ncbi:MAG: hypothetical protein FJ202_05670 [Gemmatimonadetes bacterium]|nr:hypothetical protein [Gemmatimonadota bacterium]
MNALMLPMKLVAHRPQVILRPRAMALVVCLVAAASSHAMAQATPRPTPAPGAADLTAADAAYTARRAADALSGYGQAIASDSRNYEALWKASRAAIDLAEAAGKGARGDSLMELGRTYAETAVQVRPADAEGHFALARALGRKALSVGVMDRIKYSKLIHAEATEALKHDSTHAGALHVMGMWHAEIMRVNGLARAVARRFLGAAIFGQANWADAQRFLEASARHDPARIIHKLDLAGILADRGDKARARQLYEEIATAAELDPNDDLYKRQAAERLKRL